MFGYKKNRVWHHGHSDCGDIKRSGCQISIVFDVGANIGQSATKFNKAFPQTRIFCFEPVKTTFHKLERNMYGKANISCHNIAFGANSGQATIYLTGQSNTSSLLQPKEIVGSEVVDVWTIDEFTSENQISRIDLLKIDTEGFDLDVLKGAHRILVAGQVPFVLVEVGFHPGDTRHVLFDDVRSYLLPLGYAVFGIYDQQLEWTGENRLRFANVCFSKESAFLERSKR
jgi:FkbM family methyltransferase